MKSLCWEDADDFFVLYKVWFLKKKKGFLTNRKKYAVSQSLVSIPLGKDRKRCIQYQMCFVQCKRDYEKKIGPYSILRKKFFWKWTIKNSEITYISQRDKNANCMNVMQYLYLLTRLLLPLLPCQIQCYMYRR